MVHYAKKYPSPQLAMVAAFATGDFILQEIAKHFDVHYSTVSRAVKKAENGI